MPRDELMHASLAYRKNEAAILAGNAPEKYTRLLPHITGEKIIEIGAAEGVLACLLAKKGKEVTAVERKAERHDAAANLVQKWGVKTVRLVRGDIADNLGLLGGHDTLIAVRMIYYLHDQLDVVFAEAAKHIPNVVLCGNKNRAARWRDCIPDDPGGPENYYSSLEGMKALLMRHGYSIAREETEGDPIVVGRKDV